MNIRQLLAESKFQTPQGEITDAAGRVYHCAREDFSEGKFLNFDFTNLNLRFFNFGRSRIEHSNFTGSQLTAATLSDSRITHTQFVQAELTAADLVAAIIQNCDFSQARLYKARLRRADIRDCQFPEADLTLAKLGHSKITNCDFQRAQLQDADLGESIISADFRNANLQDASFAGATLRGSDFRGAQLNNADFSSANLRGMLCLESQLATVKGLKPDQLNSWRTSLERGQNYPRTELIPVWSSLKNLPLTEIQQLLTPVLREIKTQASDVLRICKSEGQWLFRGQFFSDPPSIFHAQSPVNRKPKDSHIEAQKKFDNFLTELGVIAQRHNSVFATSNSKIAMDYAHNNSRYLFVILPKNGFKFSWSENMDDIILYEKDIPNTLEEFQKKYAMQTQNFVGALNSGHEVLIQGSFYAVNYALWQLLTQRQWI